MINDKLAILLVVESGYLEQQALLLVDSIQRFFSSTQFDVELFVFSPRPEHQPSAATSAALKERVTAHFTDHLNTEFPEFPLINGHLGARFFERHHPEYSRLMLLDTDTVFLGNFAPLLTAHEGSALCLNPVDNKGTGSTGPGDPNHAFWCRVYDHLSIPHPTDRVTTTVGQDEIWPYYNAGFVYAQDVPGFYTQWVDHFARIYQSPIRSPFIGKGGSQDIFLEQVTLAVTAQSHRAVVQALPAGMNYPIPFHPRLKQRPGALSFADLIHVHYHRWLQHPGFLPHITSAAERELPQYRWLASRVPLAPAINDPFKC